LGEDGEALLGLLGRGVALPMALDKGVELLPDRSITA
jgi:hypothetical protein